MAISHPAASCEDLMAWARAMVAAGIDAIQLRQKRLGARRLYDVAGKMRSLIPAETLFSINGRADIAKAVGATGVHLPENSISIAGARHIGCELLIGKSTHDFDAIRAAKDDGADYVVYGPVYAPISKPPRGPATGLDALARACRLCIPVLALGGVTANRIEAIAGAGAAGIAAIGLFQTGPVTASVQRAHGLFPGRARRVRSAR